MSSPLTYTLPALAALAAVARPLMCRRDVERTAAVCAAAFAWACARHAADGRAAEAVARAVAQAALTSLWAALAFRWTLPCAHFNHDAATYAAVRWTPIAALAAATAAGPAWARPCPPAAAAAVAFMWYGAGNFFAGRLAQSSWAVAAPVAYLCWADGAWTAAALWSRAAAGLTVVLAVTCCDKAAGLMDAYPSRFPARPAGPAQTFRAFVTAEHALPRDVADDLMSCAATVRHVSKTFHTYLLLLQGGESSLLGTRSARRFGAGGVSRFPVERRRFPVSRVLWASRAPRLA